MTFLATALVSLTFNLAQGTGPQIAQETVAALNATGPGPNLYLPIAPQTGSTLVPFGQIPAAIVARSDQALSHLKPLIAPTGSHPYVGYRKPSFEHEYMRFGWEADGRSLMWSDLDPEDYLYVSANPGELDQVDDTTFAAAINAWLTDHIAYPPDAGNRVANTFFKQALPSGAVLRMGNVTSLDLKAAAANLPESEGWALACSFWTDGKVLCIKFNFLPSTRPDELPSPKQNARGSLRTSSRFDQLGITGYVHLDDWVGIVAGQEVEVDIKDTGGGLLVPNKTFLDSLGNFSVGSPALPPGSYRLTVKAPHWLSQTINITISASGSSGSGFSLLNGDVNGNNQVTLSSDFTILINANGSHAGDAAYDARADLNGDGVVDQADFDIFRKNLNKVGT